MRLNEIFDNPVPYELEATERVSLAKFEVGDMAYTVEITTGNPPNSKQARDYVKSQFPDDPTTKKWFEDAAYDDDDIYDKMFQASMQFPSIMIDFYTAPKQGGMTTDKITGTGGEIKVFATVIDVVKRVVEKVKPVEIYFEASRKNTEHSRVKLYDRLAKTLSTKAGYTLLPPKEFGGYTLVNNKIATR